MNLAFCHINVRLEMKRTFLSFLYKIIDRVCRRTGFSSTKLDKICHCVHFPKVSQSSSGPEVIKLFMRMKFNLLIHVKFLVFMSSLDFMLSSVEHEKNFYNLGPWVFSLLLTLSKHHD